MEGLIALLVLGALAARRGRRFLDQVQGTSLPAKLGNGHPADGGVVNVAARLAILAALLCGVAVLAPAGATANDSIATAEGPLAGGVTYSGQLETENDEDWAFFYTNGQQQLDISFTNLTDGCTNLILSFLDTDGEEIHSVRPDVNETRHIKYTTPAAARFYLRVYDLIGETCSYQLRIDPPGALTTQPPPPPVQALPPSTTTPSGSGSGASSACRQARSRVSSLRGRLRRARGFRQRRRIRAQLRRAQVQVRSAC